jgi:D-alanyl-D-alanine carboxypeptidase
MTAYVALSAVREGRVSLTTPLTVSELAHSMPPSKMGFPPGIEVTLDNALKIIMVKSANDVSVAIAEGVGGSVEGFADMMNAAAQRLGMRESRFVNPHGLPDERQHTSARDMALLGRALFREFPEHTGYFQIGAIKFGRRVMNNHNGLMGRYAGADGMKTGFICASGFNVVASATRNGRRLITVVMGSPSAAERTIKAAALFDHGFASFGWGAPTIDQLPASNLVNAPNMRPVICERRGTMPAEEEAPPASAAATGDSDRIQMPSSALAFAAVSARPQLGPRARLEPIPVWTGRSPPTSMAADDEDKPKTAAPKPAPKPPTRAANASQPTTATPKAAADEGQGNKGAIRPSAAVSQKPAASTPKPNAGAIAAQPKPAQSAAVAAPTAAKPEAAAKSAPSIKPAAAAPAVKPKPAPKVAGSAAAEPKAAEQKPQAAAPAKPKPAPKPKAE